MLESTSEAGPPIDQGRLAAVESEIGIEFPESYKRFLLAHNGGRPNPAYFTVAENNEIVWMRIHFFFGIDDEIDGCDLLWNIRTTRGRLPRSVVPIADDEGGNLFCLDLRPQGGGRIIFWDHELEFAGPDLAMKLEVANSFDEWLHQLTARL